MMRRNRLQSEYQNKLLFMVLLMMLSLLFFPIPVKAKGQISIDTNKRYEGMGASFSKGYEPSIEKNTMTLVVPFVTDMKIQDNRIIVGISFEREENSPFYYKNYLKKVKKKKGVYLYQCKIKLKEDRVNGQYPLHLSVQAQNLEETILQDFTIYVEITDGEAVIKTGGQSIEEPEDSINENIPAELEIPEQIPDQMPEQIPETPIATEKVNYQPRVLLTDNSFQGVSLQAGESNLWNISAKNCSSSQSVENMKVTLISDNKEILFEKNSWYFERIASGNTMDLSQNVTVDKKAVAESVSLQFQFEYEDKGGNSYSSTETVNISIHQPQQAKLVNLLFPENIYESDTEPLSFQIQNTGLAVIYNAKVRLEGKGLFPEKELFLGNMEGGASLDGEIQVFAGTLNMDMEGNIIEEDGEKYGNTLATVIFSYEDEQGKLVEQSQELSTEIRKPQTVELKVEKEVPETNQWWITIVVIVILLLILIIIWLYIRMKHYQNMGNRVHERT